MFFFTFAPPFWKWLPGVSYFPAWPATQIITLREVYKCKFSVGKLLKNHVHDLHVFVKPNVPKVRISKWNPETKIPWAKNLNFDCECLNKVKGFFTKVKYHFIIFIVYASSNLYVGIISCLDYQYNHSESGDILAKKIKKFGKQRGHYCDVWHEQSTSVRVRYADLLYSTKFTL